MLSINESCRFASLLDFSDRVESNRRLTWRFRTINLNHSPLRIPPPENQIKDIGSTVCGIYQSNICIISHSHHSPLSELLFNVHKCLLENLIVGVCHNYCCKSIKLFLVVCSSKKFFLPERLRWCLRKKNKKSREFLQFLFSIISLSKKWLISSKKIWHCQRDS